MRSSLASVLLLITLLAAAGNGSQKSLRVEVNWIQSLRPVHGRTFDDHFRSVILAEEGAVGTTTLSPEAREVLNRSNRWVSTLFYEVRGPQVSARQVTQGSDDILVVTWGPPANLPNVKKTFLWDAPDVNLVAVEVDPSTVESPSLLSEFFRHTIRPYSLLEVNAVHFGLLENVQQDGIIGGGRVSYDKGPSAILKELEFLAFAYRMGTRTYVIFWAGKGLAGDIYSPGMTNVPERFPPLLLRTRQWSADSIIEQLGKGTGERDEVLLQELVQRGLTGQQFQQVMFLGPQSQSAMTTWQKAQRIRSFLRLININNKAVEYDQHIKQALHAYERMGAEGLPSLEATVGSLWWKQADYSDVVLDLLRKGLAIEAGLRYLSNAAYFVPPKKEQALALQRIQVPEKYRLRRDQVVRTMLANVPMRP